MQRSHFCLVSAALISIAVSWSSPAISQEHPTTETLPGTTEAPPRAADPTITNSAFNALGQAADIYRIYKTGYYDEGQRLNASQTLAKSRLEAALKKSGAGGGMIVIVADSPFNPRDTPDSPHFGKRYTVTDAVVAPSWQDALSGYLDNSGPQLHDASNVDGRQDQIGYPSQVWIGAKKPDGTVVMRTLGVGEQDAMMEQAKKQRAEEAQAIADEAARQRAAAERRAKDEQTRKAQQEADALRQREEAAKREAEERRQSQERFTHDKSQRDEECAKGRTAACLYADNKLTNDYEQSAKDIHTADCMNPNVSLRTIKSFNDATLQSFKMSASPSVGVSLIPGVGNPGVVGRAGGIHYVPIRVGPGSYAGGRIQVVIAGDDDPAGAIGVPLHPQRPCGSPNCLSCMVRSNSLNFLIHQANITAVQSMQ